MNLLKAGAASLAVSLALGLGLTPPAPAFAVSRGACCYVPAGTQIEVELVAPVSTTTAKAGDSVALRLAEPLIVRRQVVLRAGTPGVGQVIEAAKPGMGGKPAKLVLAARYLRQGRLTVPLQALQLAAAGRNHATEAQMVGLTGIAFAPLGFIGLAVKGGDVTFPAGTRATAQVADSALLRPLGRASARMIAEAEERDDVAATSGAIDIPPPPAGAGQVVFFRRKAILGLGQWISVREGDRTLGKLNNGTYFVDVAEPGRHTYSGRMEPEFKDKLTLEVAPGQTVFVEGTLTRGLVMGAADLSPSTRATFDKVSTQLTERSDKKDSGGPADNGDAPAQATPPPAH